MANRNKYILLILLVVGFVTWISIRESKIKVQSKKIAELEFDNFRLGQERSTLNIELGLLKNEYSSLQLKNDSLRKRLNALQKELSEMVVKHKEEIERLMNIPPDTVYLRLGTLYPNYDGSTLQYRFSASQITPIYRTAISFDLLSQEYLLQGKSLTTCNALNLSYENSILNLNSQIGNLQDGITKCDLQVKNYISEVVLLNKQIGRKSFWNRVMATLAGVGWGVALLK